MTDRFTLVSADCHAGADLHVPRLSRVLVPRRLRRLGRRLLEPVGGPHRRVEDPQLGQRGASAPTRPTASPAKSCSRTPSRRSSPRLLVSGPPAPLRSLISDGPGCGPTTGGSPSGARTSRVAAPASPRFSRTMSRHRSWNPLGRRARPEGHSLPGDPARRRRPEAVERRVRPPSGGRARRPACRSTSTAVPVPDYSTAKIKNFLMIMEVPFCANRSLWRT